MYWLMFLLPAFAALRQASAVRAQRSGFTHEWVLIVACLTVLVGWRHEVGGDWWNYLGHYEQLSLMTLGESLSLGDPGYYLIVWLFARLDWGIHAVNLLLAFFFSVGLVAFCRQQPRPWLALAIAVPYLVIVLGMGYTRQGVALGLSLLGFVALEREQVRKFIGWVAVAALFHKSAIVLIPIAGLSIQRGRVATAIWVSLSCAALYWGLVADNLDAFVSAYVDSEMQSDGATVRVVMNVLPAALLLLARSRLPWSSVAQRKLWTIFSLLAIASAIWLPLSPSSTIVDRLALYLIPLQLFVFSRFPDLLNNMTERRLVIGLTLVYYSAVLLVWLLFATHAFAWIPYQFYPALWLD